MACNQEVYNASSLILWYQEGRIITSRDHTFESVTINKSHLLCENGFLRNCLQCRIFIHLWSNYHVFKKCEVLEMQKQIMGCSCSSEYFLEWGRSIQTDDIGKHKTQQWLLN